ncbi:hypothetical protein SDC9_146138 [bioreactor metagenome]|uniref:Uncharacterized protein n=1 Tax=bioreactor metagenome TaxID=1076179 RepID=A0A645ECX8_9ZZZZ
MKVGNLRLNTFDQLRRLHVKIIQYIFCFFIDSTETACHDVFVSESLFQVGIGKGGANGIRIGILMSKNINSLSHVSNSLLFL